MCSLPSARPRRVSEACHAAAPHAAGTKAAARPRRHRRRRPRTRRAHFAARPVHVSGLAGFLVEVGERPRRGRAQQIRADEPTSGPAAGQRSHAQPPAPAAPAPRAPPSHAPHTTKLSWNYPSHDGMKWTRLMFSHQKMPSSTPDLRGRLGHEGIVCMCSRCRPLPCLCFINPFARAILVCEILGKGFERRDLLRNPLNEMPFRTLPGHQDIGSSRIVPWTSAR